MNLNPMSSGNENLPSQKVSYEEFVEAESSIPAKLETSVSTIYEDDVTRVEKTFIEAVEDSAPGSFGWRKRTGEKIKERTDELEGTPGLGKFMKNMFLNEVGQYIEQSSDTVEVRSDKIEEIKSTLSDPNDRPNDI